MRILQSAPHHSHRHGAVMVEVALVLPVLFMFLVGAVTIGIGVFRYQQIAAAAREGARYASVHGAQYAQDTGNAAATSATIYSNAILPMAVGFTPTNYSVSWPNGNWPTSASTAAATSTNPAGNPVVNTVSVTVSYDWTPVMYISRTITLKSKSVMPMSY